MNLNLVESFDDSPSGSLKQKENLEESPSSIHSGQISEQESYPLIVNFRYADSLNQQLFEKRRVKRVSLDR
jgi:hypothetical protein